MDNRIENYNDLAIFFDESGKRKTDNVQLMGGLSLPSRVYFSKQLQSLHQLNETYRYHWSEYKGDYKQREGILLLFDIASSLAPFVQLNIIRYYRQDLIIQERKFRTFDLDKQGNEVMENMLYTKLPERIMYGLLRGYDSSSPIRSTLYIEQANEYVSLHLAENMKMQLNIHALYRGEPFYVQECSYRKKGEEMEWNLPIF